MLTLAKTNKQKARGHIVWVCYNYGKYYLPARL